MFYLQFSSHAINRLKDVDDDCGDKIDDDDNHLVSTQRLKKRAKTSGKSQGIETSLAPLWFAVPTEPPCYPDSLVKCAEE